MVVHYDLQLNVHEIRSHSLYVHIVQEQSTSFYVYVGGMYSIVEISRGVFEWLCDIISNKIAIKG